MTGALEAAVEGALASGARALVVCADPPVFCAGGSLASLRERTAPLVDSYRGFRALLAAPVPTVAAVAGLAIGAGVNLPLCCDVVLVSPSARFDPRFLDVGIHPGGGHLWLLQQRVGRQGAAALVLMGDVLDGAEAVEHGLAWRCVAEDELEPAAVALATRAAGRDPSWSPGRRRRSGPASRRRSDRGSSEAQEWSMARPAFDVAVRRAEAAIAQRSR